MSLGLSGLLDALSITSSNSTFMYSGKFDASFFNIAKSGYLIANSPTSISQSAISILERYCRIGKVSSSLNSLSSDCLANL